MNVTERRTAIMQRLSVRRHDTRENLAVEFGVSVRTIEYDIVKLSATYPIYTMQGGGGGIYVVEGYYFGNKFLSDKQTKLLEKLMGGLSDEDKKTMATILNDFKK